jgi:hypothetical protein
MADVIPYLQRAGLNVTAVQYPLTSLAKTLPRLAEPGVPGWADCLGRIALGP